LIQKSPPHRCKQRDEFFGPVARIFSIVLPSLAPMAKSICFSVNKSYPLLIPSRDYFIAAEMAAFASINSAESFTVNKACRSWPLSIRAIKSDAFSNAARHV